MLIRDNYIRGLLSCILLLFASSKPYGSEHAIPLEIEPVFQFEDAVQKAQNMPRLYGLLVSWQGKLVMEQYFNGSGPDKLVNIKSASKSVVSTLVGIAVEQGFIGGVDVTIDNYFNDILAEQVQADKSAITLANLLSMQAGLETTSNRNYGAWVLSKDWVRFALNQPMESNPGTRMHYSTGNTHLLSAILTQATGMSTLQFARKHLAEPLGFHLSDWPRDPKGIYFGGNDMEMTARQMLAFGHLYMNGGTYKDKRIISANWVNQSFTPYAISMREHGRYYGFGWWLRRMAGYRTAYAWGYGGQFIILVPELELLIVTTSSSTPNKRRRSHRRELSDLIEYSIIREVAMALRRN
jgi:CubicO group peptidase (beta-lactamase class C family)